MHQSRTSNKLFIIDDDDDHDEWERKFCQDENGHKVRVFFSSMSFYNSIINHVFTEKITFVYF